jgi:hypothetical protein
MGRFKAFNRAETDLFHDLLMDEAQIDDSDEEVQESVKLADDLLTELEEDR